MDGQVNDKPLNTVLNWSSGKDAALAYLLLQRSGGYRVSQLLTTINGEHDRVFMHGTREALLDAQAQRMGLPLHKVKLPPSPDDSLYKNAMKDILTGLKAEGITHAAYGDIFLEDLKQYREQQLATIGITGVFPLWQQDTRQLVQQVAAEGIEAIIVCVNEKYLGKDFLGRKIDEQFLADLPPDVDPCGEHGEFHTFVYNAPYFSSPISITTGEAVYRQYTSNDDKDWDTGFWFLDVVGE